MITLDDLKSLKPLDLVAKYEQVRDVVLTSPYGKRSFADAADFDSFIATWIPQGLISVRRERDRLMCAFGQLYVAFTVVHRIPPSEETLAWGGFMEGYAYYDRSEAERIANEILSVEAQAAA